MPTLAIAVDETQVMYGAKQHPVRRRIIVRLNEFSDDAKLGDGADNGASRHSA